MEYTYSKDGNDFTINHDEEGENHYIQHVNPEGETFREKLQGWEVVLEERRITGKYLAQELSVAGRVISSELKSFNATNQENWAYFKSITRTGKRDILMMFNGISLYLRGTLLFDEEGNFVAESDTE